MRMTTGHTYSFSRAHAQGFTLLEVMVAILVLGIGLLGFAMLQSMNVRFTQSSNQRTQATNLAMEMLEQMRANRMAAANYTSASFTGGDVPATCAQEVGVLGVDANIERWRCEVRHVLGGEASAEVTYVDNVATVKLRWGDQRWEADSTRTTETFETGKLTLSTRL